MLLVDPAGRPVRSVHRSRFLLSMSGRYGHALYADRPALKLGDVPRTVGVDATAWEVLDVVAVGDRDRTSDDVAVVDEHGRCVGVVRLADLVRALAESRVEEAAGLNPLTRLPGSDAIVSEVDRRISDGRAFALSWLDIDHFKQVNDGAGFAAGDELIRAVGRALQQAVAGHARVGHIGGDDTPGAGRRRRHSVRWWPPCWTLPWTAGGQPVTPLPGDRRLRPRQRGRPPPGRRPSRPAEEGRQGARRHELGAGARPGCRSRGPARRPGTGPGAGRIRNRRTRVVTVLSCTPVVMGRQHWGR